jgi:hypothetical protein
MQQDDERPIALDHALKADPVREDVALAHLAMLARAMPADRSMSSDLAFSVGLLSGWLALVVWLVWPDPHCKCCPERKQAKEAEKRRV